MHKRGYKQYFIVIVHKEWVNDTPGFKEISQPRISSCITKWFRDALSERATRIQEESMATLMLLIVTLFNEMNVTTSDTFGGRNPKVGVNHVHWSRPYVFLM